MTVRSPAWGEILTRRELELTILAARGFTRAQIAAELFVSLRTVDAHFRSVYFKTGVHNRTSLVHLYLTSCEESIHVMADANTRLTIYVVPKLYQAFNMWTLTAAIELGCTRVTLTEAVRAMVALTVQDETISAAVMEQIRKQRGKDDPE